jgi:hypothetical protein
MGLQDVEYFRRRLEQELAEADRSERQEVRHVHSVLAAMYRDRIEKLDGGARGTSGPDAVSLRLEVGAIQAIMQSD